MHEERLGASSVLKMFGTTNFGESVIVKPDGHCDSLLDPNADIRFSEAPALEPLNMEPLNMEMAPVCPLGPSLGTLVPGPAYVPARWPRLRVLLVGSAYVRKY